MTELAQKEYLPALSLVRWLSHDESAHALLYAGAVLCQQPPSSVCVGGGGVTCFKAVVCSYTDKSSPDRHKKTDEWWPIREKRGKKVQGDLFVELLFGHSSSDQINVLRWAKLVLEPQIFCQLEHMLLEIDFFPGMAEVLLQPSTQLWTKWKKVHKKGRKSFSDLKPNVPRTLGETVRWGKVSMWLGPLLLFSAMKFMVVTLSKMSQIALAQSLVSRDDVRLFQKTSQTVVQIMLHWRAKKVSCSL